MSSFKLVVSEAASFSQASVADYHADRTAALQAFARDVRAAQKRDTFRKHVAAGVVAFAVVFGGALALLASGLI